MASSRFSASSAVPVSGATWSIAEVERDTGLGKDTLRVWERRYGFPTPLRDGLGERVYPDEQVQRLRLVRRMLDVGHRPGKVVPLSMTQLHALVEAGPPLRGAAARKLAPASNEPAGEAGRGAEGQGPHPALSAAGWLAPDPATPWLEWLADDRTDLIKQALQQHIVRQGLSSTVEHLVAPLCVQVGDAWLRGELPVYQEHLFTETVQAVLREAITRVDASSQSLQRAPRVLLTTTPTEQHGLGLLMAECHFAMEACVRFVLGVSTPVADIVLAASQLRIDVLALSYSVNAARRDVQSSLQQLVDQLPAGVEIWVGGGAAALRGRSLPEGVTVLRRASEVSERVQAWRERQREGQGQPLPA